MGVSTGGSELSGSGSHVQLAVPVVRLGSRLGRRAELFHQGEEGHMGAIPFSIGLSF